MPIGCQQVTIELPSSLQQPLLLLGTISNKSNLKLSQLQTGSDDPNQQQERNELNDIMLDLNQPRISSQPQQKEVKFFIPDQRLSTGSNMSTSSIDSMSDNQSQSSYSQFSPTLSSNTTTNNVATTASMLHHGICIKQTLVTVKEIKIASKAIEMITCFMQYRKDCIPHVLNMKMFNECVLDVLTGSISAEIRVYTQKFLYKLSQIESVPFNCQYK